MDGAEGERDREWSGDGEGGFWLGEGVGEVAVDGDDNEGGGVGSEEGCSEGREGWVAGFAVCHGENLVWCCVESDVLLLRALGEVCSTEIANGKISKGKI